MCNIVNQLPSSQYMVACNLYVMPEHLSQVGRTVLHVVVRPIPPQAGHQSHQRGTHNIRRGRLQVQQRLDKAHLLEVLRLVQQPALDFFALERGKALQVTFVGGDAVHRAAAAVDFRIGVTRPTG
jgi:hypothetical protein